MGLSLRSASAHRTTFTLKVLVMRRMSNTSHRVSSSTHMLDRQIPSDSWSQVFCVNACLPLSPHLHLFYWSARFPLSACTFCLIRLFVSFTLFISPASLYSLFFLPLPDVSKALGSQEEKRSVWKTRPFFMYFSLFFFLYAAFLPEGQVCHTYLRQEREKKTQRSMEQRGRESQKVIFLKGCQAVSSQRKERDKRREEECVGVKSVYLPKESDSRLPANNPFWLQHFSLTP